MNLFDQLDDFDCSPILALLSYGITVLLLIATLAGQIFDYADFLQGDGYASQIEVFQNLDSEHENLGFTEARESPFSSLISNVQFWLCVSQILVLGISLFNASEIAGKAFAAVALIPTVAAILLLLYADTSLIDIWPIPEETFLYQFLAENAAAIVWAGIACALMLVIASLIAKGTRPLAKVFIMGLGLWVVVLLIFWLLQNFISLASWVRQIIAMALSVGILAILGACLLGGSGSSEGSSGASSGGFSSSSKSGASPRTPAQRTLTFSISEPHFVGTERRDSLGFLLKGVWYTNALGTHQRACSIQDFEEGKVVIMNKGKRVVSIPGCKTPKR